MIFGDDEFYEREATVLGAKSNKWYWAKGDTGAWDGPLTDWNESHFEKYVKPVKNKGIVVTAGGAMGMYARGYSGLFKQVFVFEPDWKNFHALVHNNYAPNVCFFNAALGSRSGWCNMVPSPQDWNWGMHTVEANDLGLTPVMSVDQLNLNGLDLLQLDVEGGEYYALLGAKETIHKYSPDIVVERNIEIVRLLLEEFGYENVGTSISDYIWRKK